jgi:3-dehydroquinate synthase
VGDLAGYVAASLLRGVPFVQVPTTLLAAVDASVGGKVGIDHAAGKNLIGTFHQPKLVITDIDTFKTLPAREIKCGLAECIKHGVIRDAGLFDFIGENVPAILGGEQQVMERLVEWNVAIKAAVVEEDPFEQGVRALLNYGHTFGHAIENVLEYAAILHGEGVSLGMVAAGRMAVGMKLFPAGDLQKLIGLLKAVGLPTAQKGLDADRVYEVMFTDKKVKGGRLRFILPTRIGHAHMVSDVPETAVREAIESLSQ